MQNTINIIKHFSKSLDDKTGHDVVPRQCCC